MERIPILNLHDISHPKRGKQKIVSLSLNINKGEALAILGPSGSGKTLLGQILAGDVKPGLGEADLPDNGVGLVSFERQKSVMVQERYWDFTDFHQGVKDRGTSIEGYIKRLAHGEAEEAETLMKRFRVDAIKDRGLRFLSSGEFRKTLLCAAVMKKPSLLILDDPYDGLDVNARGELKDLIAEEAAGDTSVVVITNKGEDVPESFKRIVIIHEGKVIHDGDRTLGLEIFHNIEPDLQIYVDSFGDEEKTEGVSRNAIPLVQMNGVQVSYYETKVLHGVNWTVLPGEHWRILGANGAGKSTLLSLITGDNPKGYGQDLHLFGRKRGSGETVWEIKQNIGFVSGDLHMKYLVSQPLLAVVLSGFFDSIGLYDEPSPVQMEVAVKWIERLGLSEYSHRSFTELSFGIQRAALIIRSLIKEPPLLILDEPCQGLDDSYTQWVLSAMEVIATKSRSTILFVSHDPDHRVPSIKRTLNLVPAADQGCTGISN